MDGNGMDVFSLPDDPAELKTLLHRERQSRVEFALQHQEAVSQHQEVVARYEETIQTQQQTIGQQEQTISRLLRRLSGPQQERIDPNQLTLFDAEELEALARELAAEAEANTKANAEAANGSDKKRRPRGHGRRNGNTGPSI